MGEQYCQYCHNHWKYKKEYEKHLACCAYFYHLRRNPRPEMMIMDVQSPHKKKCSGLFKNSRSNANVWKRKS